MDELTARALDYHARKPHGKLTVIPSKPCRNGGELSLAYTPGVAKPCLESRDNPETVWEYTGRGNTVAVVSDGTAVLGLGNIGPEAGMPVMEGKCVLFKHFAAIDAVPLCLGSCRNAEGKTDAAKLIAAVETLDPSFGGINLEDIAAPACFEVETTLKQRMSIPVFHDDQHGTAVVSLSGILNALKVVGKKIEDCRFVLSGAGAAGLSCAEFYITAGARRENFLVCDSRGVIHSGRTGLTPQRQRFAFDTPCRTLADAVRGADVFVGVSAGGVLTKEMVSTMAPGAIVFAMANPTPEIFPEDAVAAGAAVVGTGRSDFFNQVNNVLGFPGIFRGALDVRARDINEAMTLAAARALAEIVDQPMPDDVRAILEEAYPEEAAQGAFAGEVPLKAQFVIPKPFDPRVVPHVARAVAEAAMASGVAQVAIDDLDAYERAVRARIDEQQA